MNYVARLAFPALLFPIANGASGQDLSQKITFRTVATPISQVVQALAAASGVKFATSPSLGNAVVVVSVKDVTLKDLTDRLASVVAGKWVAESDGTIRLTRDSVAVNKESREELAQRTKLIQDSIKKLIDSAKPKPNQDPAAGAVQGRGFGMFGGGGGASHSAIVKLLPAISPATLAGLQKGDRIVFSSSPTRMQLPLSMNVAPIISSIVKEQNDFAAKFAKQQEEADARPKNDMEQQALKFAEMFGMANFSKPIKGIPTKLLLSATTGNQFFGMGGDAITLQLKLYDDKGVVIYSGNDTLPIEMKMPEFANFGKPKEPKKGTPIKFSEDTNQLVSFMKFDMSDMMARLDKKIPAALEEKLIHPEKFDPLAFIESESLFAVAENKKLNVVANLPDSMISGFSLIVGDADNQTVESFMDSLSGPETKVMNEGGWYVVVPAKPATTRADRLDRVALAKLLGAVKTKTLPSLDDLADYAQSNGPLVESGIATRYTMIFAPGIAQRGLSRGLDWNMLRLYGSLGASQKQSLSVGGRLPFSGLNQTQLDLVRKMTFGADAKIVTGDDVNKPKEGLDFMDMIMSFMPRAGTDFREEPTELLPNGLNMSEFITLKMSKDYLAMASDEKGAVKEAFGALGADELALFKYISEDTKIGETAGADLPRIDNVKLGTRVDMEFTFHLTRDAAIRHSLQDDKIDKSSNTIPMSQLPKDFQSKIEQRMEAIKKSPFAQMIGMAGAFGGGPKPPQS